MKETYSKPVVEIEKFQTQDVFTTSYAPGPGEGIGGDDDDD